MSRPKRKPSISEQMQALITQAISEREFTLAKQLTDLLENRENPSALNVPKGKEGENGNAS